MALALPEPLPERWEIYSLPLRGRVRERDALICEIFDPSPHVLLAHLCYHVYSKSLDLTGF
jgi:hypothetical protein